MKQKSRSERFEEAKSTVSNAKIEIEELRTELESWLENMPENLQESQKAVELQEAIDMLDEVLSSIEEIENTEIMFPGMF